MHADETVIDAYLRGLAAKLAPGACAFLHHSGLGDFRDPKTGGPSIPNPHWRDPNMTRTRFRELCRAAGLVCRSQERVNWGCEHLIDCFSVVLRPTHDRDLEHETVLVDHPHLMAEAQNLKRIHELYGGTAPD